MNPVEDVIELAAKTAHEVNRAYCAGLGDTSQVPWEEAPEWQRESARNGVRGVLAGNGPEQSHEGWLEEKRATGWKYGPVKDPEKKEHPCFVPYTDLPPAQKVKDALFVSAAKGVLDHCGHGNCKSVEWADVSDSGYIDQRFEAIVNKYKVLIVMSFSSANIVIYYEPGEVGEICVERELWISSISVSFVKRLAELIALDI